MTQRRIDHHSVHVIAGTQYGAQMLQIRDSIVAWIMKPSNAAELIDYVPLVCEAETGDGWEFSLRVRYRTTSGDGDGNDILRVIRVIVERNIPGYYDADVRFSVKGVPPADVDA